MSDPLQEADRLEEALDKQRIVEILPLSEAAALAAQDTSNVISCGFMELDSCLDGGFREGDLTVISGIPGEGKCLAKGTEILMFDGTFKKVEEVRIGDTLMGPDSKPRKVMLLGTGIDELYKIKQTKGDDYTVNSAHVLVLKKTGTNREKEITVKDFLSQKISSRWKGFAVPVDYESREVPLDPYFLGVWLGDGNTKDVRITSADEEIENWLTGYAETLGLKFRKTPQASRAFTMAITKGYSGSGYSLTGELRSMGVLGNKHIPHVYIANSREVRLKLLAGLIDTDGYTNHEGYVFVNKNEQMARDVQTIARSLGFRAYLQKFRNKQFEHDYFKVGICGDCSVIPVKIARKKVKKRTQIKNILNTGIQIESVGRGKYYGFQIDGDGRFLLADFTVTHNTTMARMFTLNFAENKLPSMWFSHEMTTRELWDSFRKMGADTDLISYVPIELEDDIDWMFTHIDIAIEKFGIKAVFIDTLGDVVKSVKRQQELSNYATYLAQICKDLRRFAISRQILIFAVAHAIKQPRSRTNETDNSDIANSNGIPAAASNIFHIWRDTEQDSISYVKIGKSRRDGTKKGWKFMYKFENGKLLPRGRYIDITPEEKKKINKQWKKNY